MNKVFYKGGHIPLTPAQLAKEANAITRSNPFTHLDFNGADNRIAGAGHCDCGGNGEFELLPVDHPFVKDGMKRFMICRNCGGMSHL